MHGRRACGSACQCSGEEGWGAPGGHPGAGAGSGQRGVVGDTRGAMRRAGCRKGFFRTRPDLDLADRVQAQAGGTGGIGTACHGRLRLSESGGAGAAPRAVGCGEGNPADDLCAGRARGGYRTRGGSAGDGLPAAACGQSRGALGSIARAGDMRRAGAVVAPDRAGQHPAPCQPGRARGRVRRGLFPDLATGSGQHGSAATPVPDGCLGGPGAGRYSAA